MLFLYYKFGFLEVGTKIAITQVVGSDPSIAGFLLARITHERFGQGFMRLMISIREECGLSLPNQGIGGLSTGVPCTPSFFAPLLPPRSFDPYPLTFIL
jgi:hypothetical protein